MTLIGYTMMCEQAGPKQLVRDVTLAEEGAEPLPTIAIFIEPNVDNQRGESSWKRATKTESC